MCAQSPALFNGLSRRSLAELVRRKRAITLAVSLHSCVLTSAYSVAVCARDPFMGFPFMHQYECVVQKIAHRLLPQNTQLVERRERVALRRRAYEESKRRLRLG